jgi:hypothetical protein
LQDVSADLRRGSRTLFTLAVREGRPLDGLVRQLLHFSERVTQQMEKLEHGSAALKELMSASWRLLILMAAADAQPYFSREFLAALEPCSGFRFGFLRKRKEKLAGRQAVFAPLFDAFQEDDECKHAAPLPMALREPWTAMNAGQTVDSGERCAEAMRFNGTEAGLCTGQLQTVP